MNLYLAVLQNMGSWVSMFRERHKTKTIKAYGIDSVFSGELGFSSDEASIKEMERRPEPSV